MNLRGVIGMVMHRGGPPPRIEAAPASDETRHERSERVERKTSHAAEAARTATANWNAEVGKADRALVGRR